MELNVTTTFKNFTTGEDLKEGDKTYTYRDALIQLLLMNVEKMDGEEKLKRYLLAVRIREEDMTKFEAEDAAFLKKIVLEYGTVLTAGQLAPAFDG